MPDFDSSVFSAAFPTQAHRLSSGIGKIGNHWVHIGHHVGHVSASLISIAVTPTAITLKIRIRNLLFFFQPQNAKILGPNTMFVPTGTKSQKIQPPIGYIISRRAFSQAISW
jgi:hypothetical protein